MYSVPQPRGLQLRHPQAGVDSDKDGKHDRLEYDGSDLFAAPAGWNDKNAKGSATGSRSSSGDPKA